MTIEVTYNESQQLLTLSIKGNFDSQLKNALKQAYESQSQASSIILDLSATDYIDSSVLGMLITLRDYANQHQMDVYIKNMGGDVLEIFRVLNFHKLFKPEYDPASHGVVWVHHPSC